MYPALVMQGVLGKLIVVKIDAMLEGSKVYGKCMGAWSDTVWSNHYPRQLTVTSTSLCTPLCSNDLLWQTHVAAACLCIKMIITTTVETTHRGAVMGGALLHQEADDWPQPTETF